MRANILLAGLMLVLMASYGCRSVGDNSSLLGKGGIGNLHGCEIVNQTCVGKCPYDLQRTAADLPKLHPPLLAVLGTRLVSGSKSDNAVKTFLEKAGISEWSDVYSKKYIDAFSGKSPNGDGAEGFRLALAEDTKKVLAGIPADQRADFVMRTATTIAALITDGQTHDVKGLLAQGLMEADIKNLVSGINTPEMKIALKTLEAAKESTKLALSGNFDAMDQMQRILKSLGDEAKRTTFAGANGDAFKTTAYETASVLAADLEAIERVRLGQPNQIMPPEIASLVGENGHAEGVVHASALKLWFNGKAPGANQRGGEITRGASNVMVATGKNMDADASYAQAAERLPRGFGAALVDSADATTRVRALSQRAKSRDILQSAARKKSAAGTAARNFSAKTAL